VVGRRGKQRKEQNWRVAPGEINKERKKGNERTVKGIKDKLGKMDRKKR
jgi:hypothetical protein